MDQWQYLITAGAWLLVTAAVVVIARELLLLPTGLLGKAEYWRSTGTAVLLPWEKQRRCSEERGDRRW